MHRLKRFISDKSSKELENFCVAFDVGTSAIRALVGPILTMEQFDKWNPDELEIFCTETSTTNLGIDVIQLDGGAKIIDINKSRALRETIFFINQVSRILPFVKKKNYVFVGTAVFREISNIQEVLNHIKDRTGFEINVIDGKTEAYLSLIGIYHTRNKISGNKFQERGISSNDLILLVDQGGGSTEVSYIIPSSPEKMVLRSMPLGTRDLSKVFQKKMVEQIQSKDNQIRNTITAVNDYILEHLTNLDGFETVLPTGDSLLSNYNIYAYGMGTAIKNCFEEHYRAKLNWEITGKDFSGWILSVSEIRELYEKTKSEIIAEFPTIDKITKAITDPDVEYDIKMKLRLLYSIPAYGIILPKFGVNSIAYAYFNLRYGLYLHKFIYQQEKVTNVISKLQ